MIRTHRFHWRNIRGFLRANEGISAVEFALIAPVMLVIYFGSIELSFMMTLDRKVTSAASSLGDLAARADIITNDDLAEMIQATRMIMQPNDITPARIRLTSIADRDNDGVMNVDWSDGYNLTPYPDDQVFNVPEGIAPSGSSVILAEVEYDYESPLGFFITDKKPLNDQFYLRPRRVDFVTRAP